MPGNISEALPLIACLSFLALFAGVVVLMIRTERRRKQEKGERAVALGFQAIGQPDPILVEKLFALHTRRGRKLQLRHLFYRRSADFDLYLFDLWDMGGEDNSELIENGVLVISPHLHLPRLMLYSKIEGSGFLADAANKLITRLMAGQNRLDFSSAPEFGHAHDFARLFWVSSPDEDAARAFLTPDLLRRISTLKNIHIEAGGDAFTLASTIPGGYDRKSEVSPDQALAQRIQDAERLARWFSE